MKRLSFLILAMALSAGCASQTTVLPQNRIVTLREDKMVSLATLNAAERPAALEAALAVLPKGTAFRRRDLWSCGTAGSG